MMQVTTLCVLCSGNFEARTSYGICPNCYDRDKMREWDRLQSAMSAALRQGLPFGLTLREWLAILSDFGGRCAYCEEVPFSLIASVQPGVGLVRGNVVPCCRACDVHRRRSFERAEQRVLAYVTRERDEGEQELVSEPGWEHYA